MFDKNSKENFIDVKHPLIDYPISFLYALLDTTLPQKVEWQRL